MQSDIRAALVFMCRQVLHPLVRMLIRFEISAGELKSIVDSVYAHAGSEYLEAQGERVTYSRLAVITGINRSFLPGILATPQDEFHPRSSTQLHRAARVLNGWHDDPKFQTRTGEPAVLRIKDDPRSFEQLVHRYSGGVYYRTLLSELLRIGAIKKIGRDRVRALRRAPTKGGVHADFVHFAGETAGDLLNTLDHNLTAPPHERLPVRAMALKVDERSLALFRAQLGKRADGLIEMTDAFLQAHRAGRGGVKNRNKDGESRELTLGAAVFAICRPSTPEAEPTEQSDPKTREKRSRD